MTATQTKEMNGFRVTGAILRIILRPLVPYSVRDFFWLRAAHFSRCEDCGHKGVERYIDTDEGDAFREESCESCGTSGSA